MVRSTIRTLIRRNIQETTADMWSDATLNTLIDLAYAFMQAEVKKIYRDFNLTTADTNIVSGTALYAKPTDEFGIKEVMLLTGGAYNPIRRVNYDETRPSYYSSSAPSFADTVWYHHGTSIGLYPTPSANLASGLRVRYVPTATLAADGDEPIIPEPLQYGIVLWAAILAKGESSEDTANLKTSLAEVLSMLPLYYGKDDMEPEMLRPQLDGLRRGSSSRREDDDVV